MSRASARTSVAWIAVMALVAGCASVSSITPLDAVKSGYAQNGVWYTLPRSVVDLKLTVVRDTGKFGVDIGPQRSIADPTHRYLLQYRPLPNYTDVIDISVSPKGMLKTVKSKTKDETKQIILNIAKAFGAIGGGGFEAGEAPAGAVVLRTETVDPADEIEVREAAGRLNDTLVKFAKSQLGGNSTCDPAADASLFDPGTRERCLTYRRLANGGSQVVSLEFRPPSMLEGATLYPASLSNAPAADCSGGICYRPPVPYVFCLTLDGVLTTGVMMIPNRSAVVVIDVRRGFFIEKIQTMEFDDEGFLKQFTVDKPSEIEALSLLPVEIIGAISEGLQLRLRVTQTLIDTEKKEQMLIDQQADIERQRAQYDAAERAARANQGSVEDSSPAPRQTVQSATAAPPTAPSLGDPTF